VEQLGIEFARETLDGLRGYLHGIWAKRLPDHQIFEAETSLVVNRTQTFGTALAEVR
jgi:hypothetical protein